MSWLPPSIVRAIGRPPKAQPYRPNRVDASRHLISYYDPDFGPKPTPTPTYLLPIRTRIEFEFLDEMHLAQTHAYYEELDTIPAAAVSQTSPFTGKGGGYWYTIHPLSILQVRELSLRVLSDLRKYLEDTAGMYVGVNKEVQGFRKARGETLEVVRRELGRRETDVGGVEGYCGEWEDVGEEVGMGRVETKVEMPKISRAKSETMTEEGLRAAEEMAMKMVEDARRMERWERG